MASIHWGPNWGYGLPEEQRRFAHRLIDEADVCIVHGHSSRHAKAIEVHNNRLIMYGCGDFLNDYEGIGGYEEFRLDLSLMYFADIDPSSSDLVALELVPLQIKRFQLERVAGEDINWLQQTLDRESRPFGTRVRIAQRVGLHCPGLMSAGLPSTGFPQEWSPPQRAGCLLIQSAPNCRRRAGACRWH